MASIGKPLPHPDAGEITARHLLDAIAAYPAKPLVFVYEGRPVRAGYHVTEVKTGRFTAIDCGANPEAWSETFIQLWDVDEEPRTHMAAGKFSAIIDKVAQLSPFEPDTKLTFEVSDGVAAMQLFHASAIDTAGERITVDLARRPASCKPRDRWLEQESVASSCCAAPAKVSAKASACCV
jgi:hypothetical protein